MNNTILNSDTLNEMLDVRRNALHTIIRTKQTRQKMSNTQSLTTEEKIGIAGNHEADRIKLIKELMEEEVFEYLKFREQYQHDEKVRAHEAYIKAGGIFTWVGATDKDIYEMYKQNN